jgi:hypothetical protein
MRRDPSRGPLACGAVVALFLGIGLFFVLRHEPWRDEIEVWLVARESASLGDLFHNMRTEGHPAVWYLVTFGLTRLTRDPLAMQLANLVIAAGAVLLFFRAAPFGLAIRLLFAFGYFAGFEFGVIARSYALELLLLFAFCARASQREPRIDMAGAVLLVLLANTHLYGTMAAVALVGTEGIAALAGERRELRARLAKRLPALALAGAGAAVALLHVWVQGRSIAHPHGGGYPPAYDLGWLLQCLAAPAFGALPLPNPASEHPWESNLMRLLPVPWHPIVPALAGVGLVTAGAIALRHRPRWLATFGLGFAPMLALTLFVYYGYVRHHAQPFLWFLACAWLAGGLRQAPGCSAGPPRAAEPVLVGILVLQAAAGALLLAHDTARPFSQGRATAAFLERPEHADALYVGHIDYAVETVAAWTRRPFYYAEHRRFGTYVDWSNLRRPVTMRQVLDDAVELARRESRNVLLVLNEPPRRMLELGRVELRPDVHARFLASFTGAIVEDENYHVFLLYDPRRPLAPAGRAER